LTALRRQLPRARLLAGWGSVLVFLTVGGDWAAHPSSLAVTGLLFAWMLGAILWCAFGVVHEAEHLAEILGEPLGTLVLTLSIVVIEVVLISAVMLGGGANPEVGRDTMFAVTMIVLNGVIGLGLIVGGLRHHTQEYSVPGASAYLAVIIPLATVALILPNAVRSTESATLTTAQSVAFALFTAGLYALFLVIQTGRHREFFTGPGEVVAVGGPCGGPGAGHGVRRGLVARHALKLLINVLPIVLLSKPLGKVLDHGIDELGAPTALSGLLIALIVFTPEGVTALRAAARNELQRMVNLCLGACLSTVGLTVPAILTIGLITGKTVVLGLDPTGVVLLALTLLLSVLTFSGPRTTVLEGGVHLLVFLVYVVLIFSP
jgi:Ca2+:H+ antiporter